MALSIALRYANKMQGCSSLSKCLSPFYINVTTVGIIPAPTSDVNKSILRSNNFSTFPTILSTSNNILSNVNNSVQLLNARNMSGDHRGLWKIEKGISVLLMGVLPACVLFPNQILDNVAAILMVSHLHWGMEAIAQDYARPILVGSALSKFAVLTVYVLSVTTFGGLLFFNYTDIGIGKFVQALWALKG